jgi:hypothetical protein
MANLLQIFGYGKFEEVSNDDVYLLLSFILF